MRERGVNVHHSTMNRWVVRYSPPLEEAFHRRKRPVGVSWRLDETSIKVKGEWRDLYRAVDTHGQTIDVLLTEQRHQEAALRVLQQAIRRHGVPDKMTSDGRGAHEAAIKSDNTEHGTSIAIRQITSLHNMIEPDHRGVKRVTRPMLGFKSCEAAQSTLVGSELMPMLRKRPWADAGEKGFTPAEQFYAVAASSPHRRGLLTPNRLYANNCDSTAMCSDQETWGGYGRRNPWDESCH
jgi:putative transposase